MTKELNKNYPINVWVSTILIGPIIFCLLTLIISKRDQMDAGILWIFIFGIIYGLLLSIPALVICIFSYRYLKRQVANLKMLKMIYILIALAGMTITNYIFFGKDSYDLHKYYAGLTMTLTYGASILLAGILNKIEKSVLRK